MSAKTIAYLGCMYSGKTNRVLDDAERAIIAGEEVLAIKHRSDTRYDEDDRKNMLASHDGNGMHCRMVSSLEKDPDGLEGVHMIIIDEAQFIPGVAAFCKRQNALGREVRVAGLNSYANEDRTPWPEIIPFLGFARIVSLEAICVLCKGPAYCSRRLDCTVPGTTGTVDVGASDKYIATCEDCYTKPVDQEKVEHRTQAIKKLRKLKNSI